MHKRHSHNASIAKKVKNPKRLATFASLPTQEQRLCGKESRDGTEVLQFTAGRSSHSHSHERSTKQLLHFQPVGLSREVNPRVQADPLGPVDSQSRAWSNSHGEVVLDARGDGRHELEENDQILIDADRGVLFLVLTVLVAQDFPLAVATIFAGSGLAG